MYAARSIARTDLENGRTFAHGTTRLHLASADLTTFVDPADAALLFGFRALTPGDPFEEMFAIWMATLRRRGGDDAVVESLQRIFPNLVDDGSLVELLRGIVKEARRLGYAKVWFVPALFEDPLLVPALKVVSDELGQPIALVPTSGMAALLLAPPAAARERTAEEARKLAAAKIHAELEKANALRNDRYWEHGRGNVQGWVAAAYSVAGQWLEHLVPQPGEPARTYLGRVAASVRQARGKGPAEDDESWFDGAIDEAARIISGAATD
jgi:hypothetical protein